MTVASFIAAQRTDHHVAHAVACRALDVPASTFYKWRDRPVTARQQRRDCLDEAVKRSFDEFDGSIWPRGDGLIWPHLAGEVSGC